MKISQSIRQVYEAQKELNIILKEKVDIKIRSFLTVRWHYESRVKELTSFALKIETGRFINPNAIEDFFACTIVVSNSVELTNAINLVSEHFNIQYRRPENDVQTHKTPDIFCFDDLRIYACLKETNTAPTGLENIIFEIQIKTFLQHAWSIATHDLLYKSDDISWSQSRIAYQIKAMLEHAEISINEASTIANSTLLNKQNDKTKEIKEIIQFIKEEWANDELPKNLKLLAENIKNLLKHLRLELPELKSIVSTQKTLKNGRHPKNISPFSTIIQYIFESKKDLFVAYLKDKKKKHKIFIPDEVDLPDNIDKAELTNAIFIKTRT